MAQDLSQSLHPLFDPTLTWRDFMLEGVRLGDATDAIPRTKIKGTTMEQFPVGITQMTYRQGRAYYELKGTEHEYALADRIRSVYEHDGWLRLTGGAGFRILKGRVVEFRLDGDLISAVKTIPFTRIEKKFGKSDKKIIWEEPVDALYTITTFIYASRQLRVAYDSDDEAINGINIGAALNEEHQAILDTIIVNTIDNTLPQTKSAWWQKLFNAK